MSADDGGPQYAGLRCGVVVVPSGDLDERTVRDYGFCGVAVFWG